MSTEKYPGPLTGLARIVHDNSVEHGFYEHGLAFGDRIALLHEELSELYNAWRKGNLDKACDKPIPLTCAAEELADIVIRTLDLACALGVDIDRAVTVKHAYNLDRPYLHGDTQCPGEEEQEVDLESPAQP